jgi:formylmethanofuran dehydrogenase subunit E
MKTLVWFIIGLALIWAFVTGSMEILGFKNCHWCGELVRGKSSYHVINDKYITCNNCYELKTIVENR